MALDVPTWWGKVELFSHPVPGRLLFFDLDTVIAGNIDAFAAYDGPFCVVKPFIDRGGGINSGIMSIAPDFGLHIWERFERDPEAAIKRAHDEADPPWNVSDQRWIELNVDQLRLLAGPSAGPGRLLQARLPRRPAPRRSSRLFPRPP